MGKAESQSKHVPTTQLNSIEAKIDVILEDTSTTLEDKLDAIKLIVEAIPDFTTLEAKINEILEDTSITLEEKIDALNVLDVAIEDKLDNATYGLAALKVLIDALEGKLDHASHGLAALKTLIDAVEGKLDHPSHGLANLKTLVDGLEAKLDNATYGLSALKTLIDAVEAKLDALPAERGTDNAELETDASTRYTNLAAYVDEIESLLKNATYGLSALKTLIDAIEGKLDVPANFMADVSALALEATLGTHDVDIKALINALNDISAVDVWAADTRTLTAHVFPFTNPAAALTLTNVRTAAYPILANIAYGLPAIKTLLDKLLTGIIQGTGTVLPANKSLYNILWVDRFTDAQDSFSWVTATYGTNETTILEFTGTTRRKYQVYLDLYNVEQDANHDECYVRVYMKIDGTTYRCIDKATKTDADLIAEPGVPVEIPMTAKDVKITLQMKTALAADRSIPYHYVQEKMEY